MLGFSILARPLAFEVMNASTRRVSPQIKISNARISRLQDCVPIKQIINVIAKQIFPYDAIQGQPTRWSDHAQQSANYLFTTHGKVKPEALRAKVFLNR